MDTASMDQTDVHQIADDEDTRWQKAYDAVEKELKRTEADYKNDRTLARELTSQMVATRRDEEKMALLNEERVSHSLTELRKNKALSLDSLLDQPYFARVVCQEEDRTFEFRLGTASFPEERIVDWRESPLATIYYNHQEGERYSEEINSRDRDGTVLLRRSFHGKGKQLLSIELPGHVITRRNRDGKDEWIAAEKTAATQVRITGEAPIRRAARDPEETAFSRSPEHDGHLPQILSLLTPEQYALITSPTDRPMVIQGSAGSGKTTVALHRLAWLLNEKNSPAKPERCLVVMLNRSLQAYVTYTLPEMGVDGVRIETFGQWAEKLLKVSVGPRNRINLGRDAQALAFKALPEVLDLLRTFVSGQVSRMIALIKRDLLRFDKHARAFWESAIELPASQGHPILSILSSAITDAKRKTLQPTFIAMLEQVFRRMSMFGGDLHLLWQDEALLERIQTKQYATAPNDWKKVRDQLRLEVNTRQFDTYDDPLLLHLIHLKWGYYPKNAAGEAEVLDHLVIDEAQDFSLAELKALLLALHSPAALTLAGDLAQKIITNKSFTSWPDTLAALGFKATSPIELTVAHRSTIPIMQLAASIRDTSDETAPQYATNRMGPVPQYITVDTYRDMLTGIRTWVMARTREHPRALCGIICRAVDDASRLVQDLRTLGLPNVRLGHRDQFDFSPGVIVSNVHQVKGLEFRCVLIINPSERTYAPTHPESRNLLYVAATRAEAHLDFIGYDTPTPLLPTWLFEAEAVEEEDSPSILEDHEDTRDNDEFP